MDRGSGTEGFTAIFPFAISKPLTARYMSAKSSLRSFTSVRIFFVVLRWKAEKDDGKCSYIHVGLHNTV